jgi:hypothetical protein
VQFRFSTLDQVKAVRDLVEHRILEIGEVDQLPFLELDEAMDLVIVLHRLQALIKQESGE